MELVEIRRNILLQSDINDLIQLCSTDLTSRDICSSISFWKDKFQLDRLPLMHIRSTISAWVNEYRHTQYSLNQTTRALNQLENNTLPSPLEDGRGIYVSMDKVNDISLLIVPGLDKAKIEEIYLHQLVQPHEFPGQIILGFTDQRKYFIVFESYAENILKYETEINRQISLDLLFLIFYYHMNPYDIQGIKLS